MQGPRVMQRRSSNAIRVTPVHSVSTTRARVLWTNAATYVYSWAVWAFLALLLFAQVFGIVFTTVMSQQHIQFGHDPLDGRYHISGFNDEPYTDRLIVCERQGRFVHPVQLSAALRLSKAVDEDASGTAVNGYRVCARTTIALERETLNKYKLLCTAIDATLDGILSACTALGYNVTRDGLRIVDGLNSTTTVLLTSALPVLIMPFWDNGVYARYAIPGWDGSACVFNLPDNYEEPNAPTLVRGLTRSLVANKTREWLGDDSGAWRNGWYETRDGEKWYSYMSSTVLDSELYVRTFNATTGRELDRRSAMEEGQAPRTEPWGTSLRFTEVTMWYNSIAVGNGQRAGLFYYEALQERTVFSAYTVVIFVSNSSLTVLLVRWLTAIVLLQRSSNAQTKPIGLGTIASTRYFVALPLLLMPRLKTTLAAFFAAGCQFEGEQKALAEAWFIMYPAIGEFVLFYFSLLNLLAKLLSHRVSDALFGPTLLFFSLLHFFRFELAQSGWLEFDGRVATVVLSADFEQLQLLDFVTTDAAFRMNGNVMSLFAIKIAVLALNLAPFLWSTSTRASRKALVRDSAIKRNSDSASSGGSFTALLEIETAVVIRVATVGGLGQPFQYDSVKNTLRRDESRGSSSGASSVQDVAHRQENQVEPLDCSRKRSEPKQVHQQRLQLIRVLSCYELIRIGYLVLADRYLISSLDWFWFALVSPVRSHLPFTNVRVCVYALEQLGDDTYRVHQQPRYVCVSDAELADVRSRAIALQRMR